MTDLYLSILVEQDGKQGLCATSILYCLRREEESFGSVEVEIAVWWSIAWLLSSRIFEQEDDAVHWTEVRYKQLSLNAVCLPYL